MKNILSYSFTFQTQSNTVPSGYYENILHLSDENNAKHFVQYIQYHENRDNSIDLRHISLKVDRAYFLEVANVCINNRDRRRHFFSTLGKRRFGASNKHLDCYFSHKSFDEKKIYEIYLNHYEHTEFESYYTETTKYSTNKYRIFIQEEKNLHLVFLDQLNSSSRKKIHKIFCTDILDDELTFYNNIITPKQRINYIFNKIGKKYFKKLEEVHLKKSIHYKTNEDLALSMLITDSQAMERSSRIQDNTTFRKLQDKRREVGRVDKELYDAADTFINKPSVETEKNFTDAIKIFQKHLQEINGLKDIAMHLDEIYELADTNTISYLLCKSDHDLKDIFLYLLESFTAWNIFLYDEIEDIKSFNAASIDLADALRYFVDICYKFKHEYKCLDAQVNVQKESLPPVEAKIVLNLEIPQETAPTSAQSYFSEIDIDSEVYDELLELEREIDILSYAFVYSEEINTALIHFFEGYTRVLNPLFEFKDLSYSLMLLTQKLIEYEIDENSEMLLLLMKGLISDLLEWKRTVLMEQTAEDIHFMDKSFYSNIAQIEISLESNELGEDDGDMEFF